MNARPCSAAEAVTRARLLLQSTLNASAGYVLGGGDYRDDWTNPWTTHGSLHGGDCRVAFLWCYRVTADRPGYNHGSWATVSDCINYNSLIEDSEHAQDLVVPALGAPQEGDILAYPTIHLTTNEGGVAVEHTFIGHGAIAIGVSRWNPAAPRYADLDIMQVCGGPGRKPAAILSTGAHFDVARPPATWPKPEHQVRLLRVVP